MTDTPEQDAANISQAARRAELAKVVALANSEIDQLDAFASAASQIAADKARLAADAEAGTGTADDVAALEIDEQNERRGRVR